LAASSFHDHRSRHRLLHLAQIGQTDDGKTQLTMKWASPYVEQLLRRAISQAQDATIIRLSCSLAPGMESMRGKAYELRMHALLPKGGKFHVRALQPFNTKNPPLKETRPLTIPERPVDRFAELDDVAEFKLNCYYQPTSDKFASTDAFEFVAADDEADGVVVLRSFQATVGKGHALKTSGLADILAAVARMKLDWEVAEIQHLVVVPPDRDQFYLNAKLKGEKRVVGDDNVKVVEQVLVLCPDGK
jgi:hypothetical protein